MSVRFPARGGRLETKLFTFEGDKLTLNISTSGFGRFKVAFLDEENRMIPGYSLDDAIASPGDGLALLPRWKGKGSDVSSLAGKKVRMIIEARDADLYSFQFSAGKDKLVLPELKVHGEDCRWR